MQNGMKWKQLTECEKKIYNIFFGSLVYIAV